MINLLPSQQKEELLNQWRLRLTLILGIVFLSFFLSLFLVLFLVKSYITADLKTEEINIEERQKKITLNQELEKEITESNNLLSELDSFYEKSSNLTHVLERINNNLPSGTHLTGFNLSFLKQKGEEMTKISLSGHCNNRERLIEFKENLEEEDIFSEVYFSPESWVKPTEIDFGVTFELD